MNQQERIQNKYSVQENQANQVYEQHIQQSEFDKLKTQILDKLGKVKCCKENQGKLVYSSSCCKVQKKFVCSDFQCKCHSIHQNCQLIKTGSLNKQIVGNLIQTQDLAPKIDSIFDIIDIISLKRIEFSNMLKLNIGLTPNQANYVNNLYLDNQNMSQKFYIYKIINQKTFSKKERAAQVLNKFEIQIQRLKQSLKQEFSKIALEAKCFLDLFQSRIAQTHDQTKSLFTELRKSVDFQDLELIYRATQNNFETNAFKQKCHQKSNLLILVKNQKGKKLKGQKIWCFYPLQLLHDYFNKCEYINKQLLLST